MIRVLAFGDLHLGAGAKHRHDPYADHEAVLDQILALAEGVDLVLNAGDTFDRPQPPVRAQHVWQRFTRNLAKHGVPMITILGNAGHDQVNSATETAVELAEGVLHRVSRRAEVITDFGGVAVCTLPSVPVHRLVAAAETMPREEVNAAAIELLLRAAEDLREEAAAIPVATPALLLGHWSVSGSSLPNGLPVADLHEPVLPIEALEAIGFDAMVFGHIHAAQPIGTFPHDPSGSFAPDDDLTPAFYTGSPMCLNFGEAHVGHGVWVIELTEGLYPEVRFVPLEGRRFVTVDVDLTTTPLLEGLDETDAIVAYLAEQLPLTDAIVRIRYTATDEQHRRIDAAALRRFVDDAGAHKLYAIEPTILRQARSRVAGFDRDLDEHSALALWCDANEIADDAEDRLHAILTESREASRTASAGGAFDPISLTASSVGRFPDLHIDFQDGASVLLGPNGSGKTTVLSCLELALYAEDAGDLRELLSPWSDQLELELVFTLDGVRHRVRRSLRGVKRSETNTPSGGKATLDFEQDTVDGWMAVTQENAKATQRSLVEAIGMSRALFRASCFLAQGDGPAFLNAEPKDRKAMAGQLLDPAGLWAADALFANTRAKAISAEISADLVRISALEETAAEADAIAEALRDAQDEDAIVQAGLTDAERVLEAALADESGNQAAAERAKAAAAARDTAFFAVDQARKKADHAQTESAKLPAARKKLADREQVAAEIPALEALTEEYRTAKLRAEASAREFLAASEAATRQLDRVQANQRRFAATKVEQEQSEQRLARLRQAEDGAERCHVCEQLLGAEARQAAIATLTLEVAELDERLAGELALVEEADRVHGDLVDAAEAIKTPPVPETDPSPRLAEARAASETLGAGRLLIEGYEQLAAAVDGLLEELRSASASLADSETALAEATAGIKDTAELAATVHLARQIVATRKTAATEMAARLGRLEERRAAAEIAAADLATLALAIRQRQDAFDLYRLAERAFGRDGIPVLLLETVLPQIDADANQILRQFPTADGWTFQVRFETQREQASTDRLREELYVIVDAPDFPQDYRSLSGGEDSRVSFAIRVALAMLLGRLRGADSRLLVLDELPFLDEAAEDTLVTLVNELVDTGVFSKVLTVSHSPAVRDAFAQTIEIAKSDGRSTVVADREWAAA